MHRNYFDCHDDGRVYLLSAGKAVDTHCDTVICRPKYSALLLYDWEDTVEEVMWLRCSYSIMTAS